MSKITDQLNCVSKQTVATSACKHSQLLMHFFLLNTKNFKIQIKTNILLALPRL